MSRSLLRFVPSCLLFAPLAVLMFGCNGCGGGGGGGKNDFISIGTAGQGGAFYSVGAAIANALTDGKATGGWKKATAESTAGSLENLRRLESSEIQIGMSNSSITYFAVRGKGRFKGKMHDVKSIMTLFPLIAMFVTKEGSGIKSIKDLKGKKVVIGPQGAGFQNFVEPILEAHGIKWSDLIVSEGNFTESVGYLQDGNVAAAFLGGGKKSPSITNAASSMKIRFVAYDDAAIKSLVKKYPSYSAVTVPKGTYKGQDEDFHGLNVGSTHLLVRSDASDEFVTNVVNIIWDARKKIAATHAAGKSINPENVARYTGVDFHPAALKFYKEHSKIKVSGGPKSE